MPGRFVPFVWAVVILSVPLTIQATRREGTAAKAAVLQVKLPFHAKFGDVVVPPGVLRIGLADGRITFIDPVNMVTRATVDAKATTVSTVVAAPEVMLKVDGGKVTVTLLKQDQAFSVIGNQAVAPPPRKGPDVTLAGKEEAQVKNVADEERSELKVVQDALDRYLKSLKPCADRAQKSRWETDDPRFASCVCPWTEKWRLPPVKSELRVHQPLAIGKSGFSFTVNTKGRATDCRVWVGDKPPDDEVATAESGHESTFGERATEATTATPDYEATPGASDAANHVTSTEAKP